MSVVIAVTNQKGGVGKTTTAINLGASLAVGDKRCLIVDLDPQSNASGGLGLTSEETRPGLYDLLLEGVGFEDVVRQTEIEKLHIIPAHRDLLGAEVELVGLPGRESKLKESLEGIKYLYDFIILDCPPALGLLTINALIFADYILVPVNCEYYAMSGLYNLIETTKVIKNTINYNINRLGVLITMYDSRYGLSGRIENELRSHLGDEVFKTVVPRNISLSESPSFGKPLLLLDIESPGALAYLSLANEVLHRVGGKVNKFEKSQADSTSEESGEETVI